MKTKNVTGTRALTEIGNRRDKFEKDIPNIPVVSIKTGGKLPVGFTSIEELNKHIKSKFESFKDSLDYFEKLKFGLNKMNSTTEVNIGGKTMTIVDAVVYKNVILPIKEKFLDHVKRAYYNTISQIERLNENNLAKTHQLLEQKLGSKDSKIKEEEMAAIVNQITGLSNAELIDPMNIRTWIDVEEKEIDDFKNEVDLVLSEINAKTEFTIEF